MQIDILDAGATESAGRSLAAEVFTVYDTVFDDADGFAGWRGAMWDRHRARADFRLATARDKDRLVGFAWGYTGHRGEFWPDLVLRTLPELRPWVGGHFELVELAVLPSWRRRGSGAALHDALLDGLPHDRGLLSTDADDRDPAVRLYRSRGWRRLGLLDAGRQVMGLRLPTGAG